MKKYVLRKASLSYRFRMRKNKKVVLTGKGRVGVYIKFLFRAQFLRHDFVRFWKKWKFTRTWTL